MVKCEDTIIIKLSGGFRGTHRFELFLQIVVVKFVFTPKLRCS